MNASAPHSLPAGGRLPDFIIIGTQKGGTTCLHHYLARHPEVAVSRRKELDFFFDPGALAPDSGGRARGAWPEGLDWYRSWFTTRKPVCGEASPLYTVGTHAETVAPRMASVVPSARLIYLVRHPLDRIRSHFKMMMKRPRAVPCSFEEFVRSTTTLGTSRYGSILRTYLEHFPREQILVLESEGLRTATRETLADVFRFLGVDPEFWCERYRRPVFVGADHPHVSPLGARVRDSRLMHQVRRRLPDWLAFHVENALLSGFAAPPPPTDLPASLAADVAAELHEEMALLRRLTGAALPSLGFNSR